MEKEKIGDREAEIVRRWLPVGVVEVRDAEVDTIDAVKDLWTLGALIPVSTAYMRKKDKILLLDQPTNGEGSGGDPHFLEKCNIREKQKGCQTLKGPFDMWITPKFSDIPHGSWLT